MDEIHNVEWSETHAHVKLSQRLLIKPFLATRSLPRHRPKKKLMATVILCFFELKKSVGGTQNRDQSGTLQHHGTNISMRRLVPVQSTSIATPDQQHLTITCQGAHPRFQLSETVIRLFCSLHSCALSVHECRRRSPRGHSVTKRR